MQVQSLISSSRFASRMPGGVSLFCERAALIHFKPVPTKDLGSVHDRRAKPNEPSPPSRAHRAKPNRAKIIIVPASCGSGFPELRENDAFSNNCVDACGTGQCRSRFSSTASPDSEASNHQKTA